MARLNIESVQPKQLRNSIHSNLHDSLEKTGLLGIQKLHGVLGSVQHDQTVGKQLWKVRECALEKLLPELAIS